MLSGWGYFWWDPGNLAIPSIASGESFGVATCVSNRPMTAFGIASLEEMPTPFLAVGAVQILVSGLASAEAIGAALASVGDVVIVPLACLSGEDWGTPLLESHITIAGPAVGSEEVVGMVFLAQGTPDILPQGFESMAVMGALVVTGVLPYAPIVSFPAKLIGARRL